MNKIEHYINEVHKVKAVDHQAWMDEPWVEVDMTVNCYGQITREQKIITRSEWESIEKEGVYLA